MGAAGTGKTWGILLLLHALSLERPGLRVLACRKTRESLTESVLVTYEQEVLPLTGHRHLAEGIKRRVRQSYTYPSGTEWIVGGLDRPSKILSTSYDVVFVNEAIELAEEDWETLQSRIGRPERFHPLNCLIGDTNPGNPGHWLKARCDAGRCVAWRSRHADNPALHDGRSWTAAGLAYLARLGRLTGDRRKRLLEGEWAVGEGRWFSTFSDDGNISEAAEYDPALPVHLSIDSGVTTGAVAFQVRSDRGRHVVSVFVDYLSEGLSADSNARAILASLVGRVGPRLKVSTDPAGGSRNPVGPTVIAEYERAGLRPMLRWPVSSVADSLAFVESLVCSADGARNLTIHPRCKHLIDAFKGYRRAKRAGQWMDYPEDPQHPHEDMIDALRGGLKLEFPEGHKPRPRYTMVPARSVI